MLTATKVSERQAVGTGADPEIFSGGGYNILLY